MKRPKPEPPYSKSALVQLIEIVKVRLYVYVFWDLLVRISGRELSSPLDSCHGLCP